MVLFWKYLRLIIVDKRYTNKQIQPIKIIGIPRIAPIPVTVKCMDANLVIEGVPSPLNLKRKRYNDILAKPISLLLFHLRLTL